MISTNTPPRKRKNIVSALISTILIAVLTGIVPVDLAVVAADQDLPYYKLNIVSPRDGTAAKESTILKFIVKTNEPPRTSTQPPERLFFGFTIDKSEETLWASYWYGLSGSTRGEIINQAASGESTYECIIPLPPLTAGQHNITIYRGPSYSSTIYWRYLYSFDFAVVEPPRVFASVQQTVNASLDVSLIARVLALSLSWVGYSVNGGENVTVDSSGFTESRIGPFRTWEGNLTINGLSGGEHAIVFYAKDGWGNAVASDPIDLQIVTDTPQPTPTVTIKPTTPQPTALPSESPTAEPTSSQSESPSSWAWLIAAVAAIGLSLGILGGMLLKRNILLYNFLTTYVYQIKPWVNMKGMVMVGL